MLPRSSRIWCLWHCGNERQMRADGSGERSRRRNKFTGGTIAEDWLGQPQEEIEQELISNTDNRWNRVTQKMTTENNPRNYQRNHLGQVLQIRIYASRDRGIHHSKEQDRKSRTRYKRSRRIITNMMDRQVKKVLSSHVNERWEGHLEQVDRQRILRPEKRPIPPLHGEKGMVFRVSGKCEEFADREEMQTEHTPRRRRRSWGKCTTIILESILQFWRRRGTKSGKWGKHLGT